MCGLSCWVGKEVRARCSGGGKGKAGSRAKGTGSGVNETGAVRLCA